MKNYAVEFIGTIYSAIGKINSEVTISTLAPLARVVATYVYRFVDSYD